MPRGGACTASPRRGARSTWSRTSRLPTARVIAPGQEGIAYAAYDRGIIRVDLATRALTVVEAAARRQILPVCGGYVGTVDRSWRFRAGQSGPFRLLRLRLDDAGRRVRAVDVLDGNVTLAGPTSAAVTGNAVYYLSPAADDQVEVKKLTLK